jgi:hypothetical protein
MKKFNNLYEKIISVENLHLADRKARRGKKLSYGVLVHNRHRERNILSLHEMLKNRTFRTSKYKVYNIFFPKERLIYRLPYYPDRILHHAIMNEMEQIWVRQFTRDTYACIKKRGITGAMRAVKRSLYNVKGTQYCLKTDIRKFYPSVDHAILKRIIRRKIACEHLLELLDRIIDSAPGVPIGNYLSQYFANLYLAYLDHWIKESLRLKYYFRYADDMVFLHENKEHLHVVLSRVQEYLNDNLKLELKGNYQIFPVHKRGIDFVGFVFYHTHTRLRKSIKQNLCKVVAKLNDIKNITDKQYKMKISPWLGWAKASNCKNLLKKIIKPSVFKKL